MNKIKNGDRRINTNFYWVLSLRSGNKKRLNLKNKLSIQREKFKWKPI